MPSRADSRRTENLLTVYDGAPALLEKEGIDDRAIGLWSLLVATTLFADAVDEWQLHP